MPYCDFGGDPEQPPTALLPQVTSAHRLVKYAELAALHACETGRPAMAVEWLVATVEMGRHLAETGNALTRILGFSCARSGLSALTKIAPRLPPEVRTVAAQRLQAIPPWPPLRPILRAEATMLRWYARHAFTDASEVAALKRIWASQAPTGDSQTATLQAQIAAADPKQVIAWTEELAQATDTLADAVDSPELATAIEHYQTHGTGDPIGRMLALNLSHIAGESSAFTQASQLTRIILGAERPQDPECLRRLITTGQPFTITVRGDGDVVVSRDDIKPEVRLIVGMVLTGSPTTPPVPVPAKKLSIVDMMSTISSAN
jgi:hypothetical protein